MAQYSPLAIWRAIPRPLQEHRLISIASFFLFFTSFLLFLLVGLSLTIIKSIYILSLSAYDTGVPVSATATTLRFGVWGVCASSTLQGSADYCIGPQLGYQIPDDISSLIGISGTETSIIEDALLAILVLHLVSAALSTIVFLLSLFLHSHVVAIIALIIAVVTALVSSVVLAVDIALVVVLQDNINNLVAGLSLNVDYGNGVWMVLVAVILTWTAVVVLSARACYCCGVRRPKMY